MLMTTSLASKRYPSPNRTFVRSVQVQVTRPASGEHFSASDGNTAAPPGAWVYRLSMT
jgi:hypothetical protein